MPSPRTFLFSLEQIGIKLGLDQIRGLVGALDRPDRAYPSIIVAGTNGKGSVAAMIERGLRTAGYRTGRYTSPHLVDLEERFAIAGDAVSGQQLDEALARVERAADVLPAPPSFFEATTAAALDIFRSAQVDVAVLEVGLGGRLDATNVVEQVASAITAIDFDHQQFLGDTLEAIAAEKAGVIKPSTLAVLAENPPAVDAVVTEKCREVGADLIRATEGVSFEAHLADGRAELHLQTPRRRYASLRLGLRGRHQVQNAITAVRLLEEVNARGHFDVGLDAIRSAVQDVVWPARLELLDFGAQQVLIDGAHNVAGARALADFLRETYARPLPVVLGVLRDKDVSAVVAAITPVAACVVCTAPRSPRALTADELADVVRAHAPQMNVVRCPVPIDAVRLAAETGSPVIVAGSLYLAGEVRAELS